MTAAPLPAPPATGDGPPVGDTSVTARLERFIFSHRMLILVVFALVTVALLPVTARGLRIDASFTKQLPVRHEYMRTYLSANVAEFRGANRLLIALLARDGNMFQPEFFDALRQVTDEVVVTDGIDRGRDRRAPRGE